MTFLTPEPRRYQVLPMALRRAREAAGLSIRDVAEHMGWTRQYQSRLETFGGAISEDAATRLKRVVDQSSD